MKSHYFRSVNQQWYFAITPQENTRVHNDLFEPHITTLSESQIVVHDSLVECSEQEFEKVKATVLERLEYEENYDSPVYPDYTGL